MFSTRSKMTISYEDKLINVLFFKFKSKLIYILRFYDFSIIKQRKQKKNKELLFQDDLVMQIISLKKKQKFFVCYIKYI